MRSKVKNSQYLRNKIVFVKHRFCVEIPISRNLFLGTRNFFIFDLFKVLFAETTLKAED